LRFVYDFTVPFTNNLGEQDIRQTYLKLGINFIDFLRDRVRGLYVIPRLAVVIRERALAAASDPPYIPPTGLNLPLMKLWGISA
jgi:hypothetical protein